MYKGQEPTRKRPPTLARKEDAFLLHEPVVQCEEAVGMEGKRPELHATEFFVVAERVERRVQENRRNVGLQDLLQLAERLLPFLLVLRFADKLQERIGFERGVLGEVIRIE